MAIEKVAIKKLALSLILSAGFVAPALADAPMEVFSNTTKPNQAPKRTVPTPAAPPPQINNIQDSSFAMNSARTPAVEWFEQVDNIVASYQPTDADKIILKRPFNQEAERVQEWTKTAKKISNNYKTLALQLKATSIPAAFPKLGEYRNLLADWYSDSAEVYDELVKPRPPAKTIEELNNGLNAINDKANSLAATNKDIHQMDDSLRREYKVHYNRNTDSIYKYVNQKLK